MCRRLIVEAIARHQVGSAVSLFAVSLSCRFGIPGEDPTYGGGDPSAQGLALPASSVSEKSGPFDHRMDQPRDELGDLVEVVRVGWHVERGPGSLDQPAGEQQCRAARHVIRGPPGTEPCQLAELGIPREPLEEQAANLRHDLGRGGTEIDLHGSDTGPERFDRFQRDRQEDGLAAGVMPIDGRTAHAQLACHLGDPHVDPAAVDAPARRVTNPLCRFGVIRRRSASPAWGDFGCTMA